MRTAFRASWLFLLALAWATLGYFWWRSERVMDEWSAVNKENTLRAAVSYRGSLHFIRAGRNSTRRDLGWDSQSIPPRATLRDLHGGRTVVWEKCGFIRISSPAPPQPARGVVIIGPKKPLAAAPAARAPIMNSIAPWLLTYPYDAWVVPYWAVLVVVSLPLTRLAFVAGRRVHRRFRGRCRNCGYDLRMTPGQCPECGTKTA